MDKRGKEGGKKEGEGERLRGGSRRRERRDRQRFPEAPSHPHHPVTVLVGNIKFSCIKACKFFCLLTSKRYNF